LRVWIGAVVAIAGALLVFAAGCGTQPAAHESGRLVYDVSTANGSDHAGIFVVDEDGQNRRRLTSEPPPSDIVNAEWSPRGGTILFDSELQESEEFWTIDSDGSGLHRLGQGAGAIWSSDGREIAISAGDDEISIVGKDGSPRRTIRLGLEKGLYPDVGAWSPDGALIAIGVLNESTESRIFVVATDGKTSAKPLTKGGKGVSEESAAWSPDGKWIAYIRVSEDASEGQEIWIMRRDGSGHRRVTSGTDDVRWSPDGASLIFTGSFPREDGLYRVPVAGGEPVRIGARRDESENLREPGGQHLLHLRGGLAVSRLDGSDKEVLAKPHEDATPLWSPDAAEIAFTRGSENTGRWDVFVVGADGKNERRIAAGGSPVWLRDGRLLISRRKGFSAAEDPNRIAIPVGGSTAVISPDGQTIAFVRDRSVHTGSPMLHGAPDLQALQSTLFLQRAYGGGVRELAKTAGSAERPLVFGAPVWAPDGRSVFIQEDDPLGGGSARVRQIPVDGGDETTVASADGSDIELFSVAPDGKKVALITPTSIDAVQLDKGERKAIVNLDAVGVWALKWSADGKKLAYVVNDYVRESVYKLFVVNADGSDRTLVSKPGDAVGSFDWSPTAPLVGEGS
jgi:Tol biopolymer transport system component